MKSLLLFLVLLTLPLPSRAAAPVKIAIFSTNPALAEETDLLTVELSGDARVGVLERAELNRILGEQALSAGQRTNYLALGRLLGADGLVILDLIRPSFAADKNFVAARWVAVRPGAVLDAVLDPQPATNRMAWVKQNAQRTFYLLPKMALLEKEAIGISMLNLRGSLPGATARDRFLTTMLQTRLSRETNLLVMERQNMDRLQTEKFWGADESAFWNGGYTLEGTIDPDGKTPDSLTVELRLASTGKNALTVRSTRKKVEEAELINDLAVQVARGLGVASRPILNPRQEAAAYLEEARWALRWGLLSEAQSAANASWALGNRSPECSAVRIRSYASAAGDCYSWGSGGISTLVDGKVVSKITARSRPSFDMDVDRMTTATVALQLALDDFSSFARVGGTNHSEWLGAGSDALESGQRMLRWCFYSPTARKTFEGEIIAMRRQCRDLSERLLLCQTQDFNALYFSLEGLGWWHEGAEDALAVLEGAIGRPEFASARAVLVRPSYEDILLRNDTPLPDWSNPEGFHGVDLWKQFVEKLSAQPDPALQLEGALLRLSDDTSVGDVEKSLNQAREIMHRQAVVLIEENRLAPTWKALSGLAMTRLERVPYDVSHRLGGIFYPSHEAEFAKELSEWKGRQAEGYLRGLAEGTDFRPFDLMTLSRSGGMQRPQGEAVERQTALLDRYLERLAVWMKDAPAAQKGPMRLSSNQVVMAKRVLALNSGPAPAPRPIEQRGNPLPPAVASSPLARFVRVQKPAATNQFQLTQDLRLHSFQTLGAELWLSYTWEAGWDFDALYAAAKSGNGEADKILRDISLRQQGLIPPDPNCDCEFLSQNRRHFALARIDSATARITRIDVPEKTAAEGWGPGREPTSNFGVTENYAVALAGNRIRVLDRAAGRWTRSSHDALLPAALTSISGRFFLQNRDSILEYEPREDKLNVLASTRRNPPRSPLDSVDLNGAKMVAGPKNEIILLAAGQYYFLEGADWKKIGPLPGGWSPIPAGTMLLSAQRDDSVGNRLYQILIGPGVQRELLLRDLPSRALSPQRPTENPLFDVSPGSTLLANLQNPFQPFPALLGDSTNFWVLSGRLFVEPSKPAHLDPSLVLRHYIFGHRRSQDTPIQLELPDPLAEERNLTEALSLGNEVLRLHRVGNHLALVPKWCAGVWLLPVRDLPTGVFQEESTKLNQEKNEVAARRQSLLVKYPTKAGGTLDPAQREAQLNDPDYISEQLANIDRNKNGMLDAEEVSFFDLNGNSTLEPREYSGLLVAFAKLVETTFRRFDENHDGFWNAEEFDLWRTQSLDRLEQNQLRGSFSFYDANKDGKLDTAEVKILFTRHISRQLQTGPKIIQPGQPIVRPPNPELADLNAWLTRKQSQSAAKPPAPDGSATKP